MRVLAIAIVLVAAACVGGCTTGSTPATAPSTTVPPVPSTSMISTTSEPSTTTTPAPTSTFDHLTEIQAIFDELERRRLTAIANADFASYESVFANDRYRDRSREVFDSLQVLDPNAVSTVAIEVLAESEGCIAAEITRDMSVAIEGGSVFTSTWVIEMAADEWGLSWIGEGWLCDGPHPFS